MTSNSRKEISPSQALYQQGDLVYVYGDRNYTGMLIRPLERTYPQKWTVAKLINMF